tara:strand:- start:78397 stop:78651 length:255 start_codon:yes stop_codon:yes gene_type:complete
LGNGRRQRFPLQVVFQLFVTAGAVIGRHVLELQIRIKLCICYCFVTDCCYHVTLRLVVTASRNHGNGDEGTSQVVFSYHVLILT